MMREMCPIFAPVSRFHFGCEKQCPLYRVQIFHPHSPSQNTAIFFAEFMTIDIQNLSKHAPDCPDQHAPDSAQISMHQTLPRSACPQRLARPWSYLQHTGHWPYINII